MVRAAPAGPAARVAKRPEGQRRSARRRRTAGAGITLSLPVAAFFVVFWVLPFCNTVYLSFTDYALAGDANWVGLENYRRLLDDPQLHNSIKVTAIYTVCSVVPTVALALLAALPLARPGKVNGLLRAGLLVPAVMPFVATSIIWVIIYADGGLADTTLDGLGGGHISWLGDERYAMWSLIVMVVWKHLGLFVLIFTAGIQGLDRDVFEAAALDGAKAVRTFFSITLPLLRRTLLFVLVIAVTGAMQSFIPAYLLTQGGPANATEVLPLYLYNNAFGFQKMGYASALAVVLLLVMLILSAAQFRVLRGGEDE
nr:sugar ABC transporter permease [Streptomyces coryli]